MQYRVYSFQELPLPYNWQLAIENEQYAQFTNRDTLAYATGGAVAAYSIDSDYMVSNNSTVELTGETTAVAGQIITLIDDAGEYDTGVITSVDNKNRKILYKSLLSLFDGDILNPARGSGGEEGEGQISYLYDGVIDTARILASYYAKSNTDKFKRLPIYIRTSGGGKANGVYHVPAIWNYTGNTVNVRTWLTDLFNKHNVVLKFRLVFEASRAYIEILILHNTTGGRLIKNNIHGLTVKYTEESVVSATVCQVIDQSDKRLLSTWYLLNDNTVTTNENAPNRMQPYKLTVAEFNSSNTDGATEQTVAEDALKYSDFNHYINLTINKQSSMFPKNLTIGDAVTVVTELEKMDAATAIENDYKDKVYKSIFTGRKESNKSNDVTLVFGKIRISYTDLIQMRDANKVRR